MRGFPQEALGDGESVVFGRALPTGRCEASKGSDRRQRQPDIQTARPVRQDGRVSYFFSFLPLLIEDRRWWGLVYAEFSH